MVLCVLLYLTVLYLSNVIKIHHPCVRKHGSYVFYCTWLDWTGLYCTWVMFQKCITLVAYWIRGHGHFLYYPTNFKSVCGHLAVRNGVHDNVSDMWAARATWLSLMVTDCWGEGCEFFSSLLEVALTQPTQPKYHSRKDWLDLSEARLSQSLYYLVNIKCSTI